MAPGPVLPFVFRAGLGIWERWGSSILQARFLQPFVGIYSAQVLIADCIMCVLSDTHFSWCLCGVEAVYRGEPGRSEGPAVTRRKPKQQNPQN